MQKPFLVLFAAVLSAAMWIWVQAIAVPHQQAESAAREAPRGNLSDLYPRWLGARELLLHHRDPYGDDITQEIQIGYYGRVLDPSRPNDPKDQQAFAYPIYVVLMLAPVVQFSFGRVHSVFFWIFGLLTAVSVLLWLRTLRWRIPSAEKLIWVLLVLSCFPSIQGLKLLQLSVLVAALVAGCMFCVSRHRFFLAGLMLALATIKPQLVFLLVLWLCIWIVGNWRARRWIAWSFVFSMTALVIAGELLLPGWIHEFRIAMSSYYRYTGGGNSVLDVVLTPTFGRLTAAILVGILLAFAWSSRHEDESSPSFQYLLSLTLATTLLVIPMYAPYNQVLLVPAFMIFLRSFGQLWNRNRLSRFCVSVTAASICWPFLAGALLVFALAFLPGPVVQKAWGLPFYPSFAIPITIYAMLLSSRSVLSSGQDAPAAARSQTLQPSAASE
jgi:hypothetical protein